MRNSTSELRSAEREVRQRHVLLAAEQVFGRRPFDEASMQEVARESGLGMQSLYALYPSKQRLFEAVVLHRMAQVQDLLARVPESGDPAERLQRVAVAYAAHFFAAPQFFPLWATMKLQADWKLRSRFSAALIRKTREVESHLEAAISEAVDAGILRRMEPTLLLELALSVFRTVVQHALLHEPDSGRDPEAAGRRMRELLLEGAGRTA
jgi:AcrR family transcriptional regulator